MDLAESQDRVAQKGVLFLRAMSQADAKHPFGECRVASLMPRQPAAGFGLNKVYLKGTKYGKY